MEKLDSMSVQGCNEMPKLDIVPRVFVKAPDGDYKEIPGIKSFERTNSASGGLILFSMNELNDLSLKKLLCELTDQYVDVKMEFMLGMLMVMSFSGIVEHASGGKIIFSVSTPMTTDVQDVVQ